MADVDQLAVVARQRLEPGVGGLDEDLRLVAGARAARAGCRALRGRWRRRSRASRAPGGSGSRAPPVLSRRACRQRAARHVLAPRGRSCAAAVEPAGQRIDRAGAAGALLQPLEHVEVLALDDRPVVVVAEELAAVAAERAGQPAVLLDRLAASRRTRRASRSTARRCCEGTGPSARRTCRWRAPAGRAPTLRAPPSTGSRSTTA